MRAPDSPTVPDELHRATRELTRALLASSAVAEAAVIPRRTLDAATELVAYVVPAVAPPAAAARAAITLLLRSSTVACRAALVSTLPRDSDGRLDVDALGKVPILDEDLVRACEERLRAHPDVTAATVSLTDLRD